MRYRKRILVLTFTLVVLYCAMASLMSASDILDARFYYSAREATGFFAALEPPQNKIYLEHELLDLVFLSSYTALFGTLAKRVFPNSSSLQFFAFAPGLFDLIETGSIMAILLGSSPGIFVGWLGVVTCCKWIAGSLFAIAIFVRYLRSFLRG